MGILGDKLIQKIGPKQREVWFVKDKEIRMHPGKAEKNFRPVLIVSSETLLNIKNYPLLNVVPLSTSVEPDKYVFPLERAYEELANDFKPDANTCAVIPFYQPIELDFFEKRCGTIDETTYNAITFILCTEIVGYSDFNLEP